MDTILIAQLIDAVVESDLPRFVGYAILALVVWKEVRGLKVEVKNLSDSIAKSFEAGNARFVSIEDSLRQFEHRLTVLEKPVVTVNLGAP